MKIERIKCFSQIEHEKPEGVLIMELLARLTTMLDTDKTPDEVLQLVSGTIPWFGDE